MDDSPFPNPTAEEIDRLVFHIVNWTTRSTFQQSICLAVLRGYRDVPGIANVLGRSPADVQKALRKLIGDGLLWEGQHLLIR